MIIILHNCFSVIEEKCDGRQKYFTRHINYQSSKSMVKLSADEFNSFLSSTNHLILNKQKTKHMYSIYI